MNPIQRKLFLHLKEQNKMPVAVKKHDEYPMGYDRTQRFKEETQPKITRCVAMSAIIELVKLHNLKPNATEYIRLVDRFVNYIETGDKSFFEAIDKHYQLSSGLIDMMIDLQFDLSLIHI